MKIRNKSNHGIAEVGDELGQRLIEAGVWEAADKPVRRGGRRATQKPAEATNTEQ
jgi:hypothetical protein